MKIYLDNNLGVEKVEQEELTQDTYGYNILKVYIPNAVLTPYDTFTCYYGALLQNGRKVGWFAMEARTSSDADYEANYTLYKATLEQCIVSVEGKVYIGCQVLLGNSGNATLIKKNTAVVQFNVRKSVAINNDILVLDSDQTNTDVLESYKNLLENALTTYATKATTYTKTEVNSALALKADKSTTYTKTEVDGKLDLKADKSDTYTKAEVYNKTESDNTFAPKSNAITHTGNQLKDSNGNNIYPNLNDGQITYSTLDSELKGILYKNTDYSNDIVTYKLLMTDGTLTNSNEETAVVTNEIDVNVGDKLLYAGAWYVSARAGVVGYKEDNSVVVLVGSTDYPNKQISTPIMVIIPDDVVKIKCASNNITQFPLTATLIQENVEPKHTNIYTSSNLLPIGIGLTNKTVVFTKNDNEYKIESPNVFWDPILSRYGMVYTSYDSDGNGGTNYGVIKYAYSYDLKTWVNDDTTILTPNSTSEMADSGSVTAPVVYIENGTYYLFYCGCTNAGYEQGKKTICLATGTDITNLTRYENNPIISKKAGEYWYNTDCYHANINKVNDTYYLFFNALGWGYGYNEHKAESIGYAVSKDLLHWEVSEKAVVKYGTNNSDYDYSIVGDPYLFDIGDDYIYMAYFAYSQPNPQGMHDYLAKCKKSDFPNGWVKTNIKLTTSSFNAKPSIIFRGGKVYHFYGANGNNIGYYTE